MMTLLICVATLVALGQVFVSYCRTALASARAIEPSQRVLEIALVSPESPSADDFERFYQLVRLCPEGEGDGNGMRAVGIYHDMLMVLSRIAGNAFPELSRWILRERESCSHFAAVVLDRSISCSLNLLAE